MGDGFESLSESFDRAKFLTLLEKHETDAGCGGLLATCVFFTRVFLHQN